MAGRTHTAAGWTAFRRREEGAVLVEFALMLPVMLLVFAVIIEGGRMMWSYQAAISGVRDAARYLARVAPQNICSSGGSVDAHQPQLLQIVRESITGDALFPARLSVTSVTPSLSCQAGSYRISPAPVVSVRANLTMTFPFAGIFELNGGSRATINTVIADQSRVFGT
ncbi:TadE/TadG family type IV pilus assembly protein [Leisingera sp. ANG59]|uniref:TadE/TadG family type IV pilus assembly protein n=1 Tax=Leisingera sp. ANG59 TaxID=2675221 RepID=UPI001571C0FE|nr:TadE/TadG family type IV pilus assembly protein [Leisingera sp. ANG59]NSY39051.1 pilus assembly protein [Leisingera sp. ANG59]